MEKYFKKYKRFLGTFFLLWLFLQAAGFFGFSFGVNLHLLFRIVFLLGLIWVIGGIRGNWGTIYPLLKDFVTTKKSEFSSRTKTTQAEIIAFSPRILGNKAGSFIVLPLAVALGVFRGFGGIIKKISRLFFSKEGVLFLLVLGILGDVFVLDFSSDLIILFLAGLWIWSVRRYQFEGRVSVAGGLVFLVLGQFLFMLGSGTMAEKAATWTYLFLVMGVVQGILEKKDES